MRKTSRATKSANTKSRSARKCRFTFRGIESGRCHPSPSSAVPLLRSSRLRQPQDDNSHPPERDNGFMRAAIPLVLLLATSAFAQAERDPKTLHDAERSNDDIVARRAFDASARAMLTPKYREVIEHYAPASSDLKSAWGDFVAAD